MLIKFFGNFDCLRNDDNFQVVSCVVKYIIVILCKVNGGKWVKFIINYLEKIDGVLEMCEKKGYRWLVKGLLYEFYMYL